MSIDPIMNHERILGKDLEINTSFASWERVRSMQSGVELPGSYLPLHNLMADEVVKQIQSRTADPVYMLNFTKADVSGQWLGGFDLHTASFVNACAAQTVFMRTNLFRAMLNGAFLEGAIFTGADLRGASLADTWLDKADFRGANLHDADLRGAHLEGVRWDWDTVGLAPAPEGELIGWGWKSGHLVQLLIPRNVRRSCATGRKFRAECVVTLEIDGCHEHGAGFTHQSGLQEPVVYEVGQITRCDNWCEDRWQECAGGIHFFLSRHEALTYGPQRYATGPDPDPAGAWVAAIPLNKTERK